MGAKGGGSSKGMGDQLGVARQKLHRERIRRCGIPTLEPCANTLPGERRQWSQLG